MGNEGRKCFTFFNSFYFGISSLPDEEDQLRLYKAIAEYALFDAEPQLDGVCAAMFELMRPNINSSNARRANGEKGGAPKGNQNAAKGNKSIDNRVSSENRANNNQNSSKIQPNIKEKVDIEGEEDKKKEYKEKIENMNTESGNREGGAGEGKEPHTTASPARQSASCGENYAQQSDEEFENRRAESLAGLEAMKNRDKGTRRKKRQSSQLTHNGVPIDYGSPEDFYR